MLREAIETVIVFVLVALLLEHLADVERRLLALEGGAKILKGPWPDRTEDNAS